MRRYPFSFIALTSLGILPDSGAISLAGFGASLHPVLDDPWPVWAFIVSAIALIGSGLISFGNRKAKGKEAPLVESHGARLKMAKPTNLGILKPPK